MDRLFPAGKFFNKTEAYRYQYDKQDRILGATYGYYDASSFYSETNGALQERNIKYDANGNLLELTRTGYQLPSGMTGNVIDSLRYSYKPNTNQLVRVEDRAPTSNDTKLGDLPNQTQTTNYVYDAIGRMLEDKSLGIVVKYTAYDRIASVQENGKLLLEFGYDDGNYRIFKKTYDPTGVLKYTAVGGVLPSLRAERLEIRPPMYAKPPRARRGCKPVQRMVAPAA